MGELTISILLSVASSFLIGLIIVLVIDIFISYYAELYLNTKSQRKAQKIAIYCAVTFTLLGALLASFAMLSINLYQLSQSNKTIFLLSYGFGIIAGILPILILYD